jgi:hypothetical protein
MHCAKRPKQQTWAKGVKSLNTLPPPIELLKVKVEACMVLVWFCHRIDVNGDFC